MKKIFIAAALLAALSSSVYAEESQIRYLDQVFMNAAPGAAVKPVLLTVDRSAPLPEVHAVKSEESVVPQPPVKEHNEKCCQKSFAKDFNWNEDWRVGVGFLVGMIAGIAVGAAVASGGLLIALGMILFAGLGAYGGHVLGNAIRRKNCKSKNSDS